VKNKIDDLRNVLFETLDDLRDKEKPMEIERAKAIAGVAQVIVDSAKAENDFIKLTGSKGSGFIPKQLPPAGAVTAEIPVQHRILPAENGHGRLDLTRCPDPNCGGILSPRTNGNGGLKDVCDKCHRSIPAKELATA
jgi:hypothetical protein